MQANRTAANDYRVISPGTLETGTYSFSTECGGPEVGAFRAELVFPEPSLSWSHNVDTRDVALSEGITVTWRSNAFDAGRVVVSGGPGGGVFSCVERASKASFWWESS